MYFMMSMKAKNNLSDISDIEPSVSSNFFFILLKLRSWLHTYIYIYLNKIKLIVCTYFMALLVTSSASVIRVRHLRPSFARGVHMCTRLSSVKYVEYRIAFCLSVALYHCFYGTLVICVKCKSYVCKSYSWIMLQWYFGVILIRWFVSLSLGWICKGGVFPFKSAIYVKYLLIHVFQ